MRKTPLKKKSTTKKASLDRHAEKYAAAWCKRHGKCLHCGTSYALEWAHIVHRRTKRIKFHPENAVCLCHTCHVDMDTHPATFHSWIEKMFPGRWEFLAELERTSEKIDYDYWISYYRDTLGVRLNGEWKND